MSFDTATAAIPASAVNPGRWHLRWLDGQRQEHIRKVVVSEQCHDKALAEAGETLSRLSGNTRRTLWVQFADENWQPQPYSSPMLISYLPNDAAFLAVGEGMSDE